MRVALISDIHGNFKALQAFMEWVRKDKECHMEDPVRTIIGLGDYVTDAPHPERTMALLYELIRQYQCFLLKGNREAYLLENRAVSQGWKPSSRSGNLLYTYERLTEADLDFLEGLPPERELCLEGYPPLYCCHGTPGKIRGNMVEDEGLRDQVMEEFTGSYLLGGHSHHQETDHRNGKIYVNPGSLGLSFPGQGGLAEFAVLTGTEQGWDVELIRIPYDLEGYLHEYEDSEYQAYAGVLYRANRKSLITGRNIIIQTIRLSEQAAAHAGYGNLHDAPESLWEQVAAKLEL